MEQYRLRGNAFYQQEMQRRNATPPSLQHPAFRQRSNSDPPTPPQSRISNMTTMSPFINAGKENSSPPLKLVPENAAYAWPTRRGYIEEQREQFLHDASGSEEERTPVYTYLPNAAEVSFTDGSATPKKRVAQHVATQDHSRSPRKGLLEKLRFTNSRPASSPSSNTLSSMTSTEDKVPPKAQAVLGTSPSKANISRSPSKKKKLFSRKSDVADTVTSKVSLFRQSAASPEPPQTAVSTAKTPQSAWSDPTHYSYDGKRVLSNQLSEQLASQEATKKAQITRSQSLKYFDERVPPTPPAKNTPPHERDARLSRSVGHRHMNSDQTPSRDPNYRYDLTGRISPTKLGTYGYKETPTLIEKPSIYSMHASVFPNFSDATTYEEMKARVEGLGLEGLSAIPEKFTYSPKVNYSPSIYSSDWGARASTLIGSPPTEHESKHTKSPSMPVIPEYRNSISMDTKKSSSSGGTTRTMNLYYPEMATDPSISDLDKLMSIWPRDKLDAIVAENTGERTLNGTMPYHGRTHSRDHSNSPRHSSIEQEHRNSADVSIFALPESEEPSFSPASHHPSAWPSPLHTNLETLPNTVYTPPPPRTKRALKTTEEAKQPASRCSDQDRTFSDRSPDDQVMTGSPTQRSKLFLNVPKLSAQSGPHLHGAGSAEDTTTKSAADEHVDVDPQKPSVNSDKPDKLDKMLEMLTQMNAQFNASTSRLDERLSAVEHAHGSNPPSPYGPNYPYNQLGAHHDTSQPRVDVIAREAMVPRFLSDSLDLPRESADRVSYETEVHDPSVGDRLASLIEGFAQRLESIEKRISGRPSDALPHTELKNGRRSGSPKH